LLSRLGLALAAAPVFPVLPISRAQAQGKPDRGARRAYPFHHERSDKDETSAITGAIAA